MSKSKLVNVRMASEEWEAFKARAEKEGLTASALLKELIRRYMDPSEAPRAAVEAPRGAARAPSAPPTPVLGAPDLSSRPFRPLSKAQQAQGRAKKPD